MTNWQGEVKGIMYSNGITNIDIADKLGLSREYIAKLFTGKVLTPSAEDRIRSAVSEIIAERSGENA